MKKIISALLALVLVMGIIACPVFYAKADKVVKGDLDGDGLITVADALYALRISVRLLQPTSYDIIAGDIDKDGEITVADALAILRVAAKLSVFEEDDNKYDGIKVGLICIGDEDSFYDVNYIGSLKQAFDYLGIDESRMVIKRNVPEEDECKDAAADLADEGCNIIFAYSFGHEQFLIEAARDYPNVQFGHIGGVDAANSGLSNMHNGNALAHEGRFLTGVVAGMKLSEMIEKGEITADEAYAGYVGTYAFQEIISAYTAFYLGVKYACPSAKMKVSYSGSWFDPGAEADCARELIEAGCKVISEQSDSMGVPYICQELGVYNVPYSTDTLEDCPDTSLVCFNVDWTPFFEYIINSVAEGKAMPADWLGGIKAGTIQLFGLNEDVLPEGTQAMIDLVKSRFAGNSLEVFDTSTFTVDGERVTSHEVDIDGDFIPDTEAIIDGCFKECYFRSAPYFDIEIDGIDVLNHKYPWDIPEGGGDGENNALCVATNSVSGNFSPFFATLAGDYDIMGMTQVYLVGTDRGGAPVFRGIEGTTVNYNGTDYTYYGPANIEIYENQDGSCYYDFTLRNDMSFSDGKPVTADDLIFTFYVLCDPSYNGSYMFNTLPIEGLAEYRAGMATKLNCFLNAGRDNEDFTNWTRGEQEAFWADMDRAGELFAGSIVDCCKGQGYNGEDDTVAQCAYNWGYELKEDATLSDFFKAMCDRFEGDLYYLSDYEKADADLFGFLENYDEYMRVIVLGESAANITGIRKTGDYSVRVTLSSKDATALYSMSVPLAPMHYYGSEELYNYAENRFGFPKGDLSGVREMTGQPMGAGPYIFTGYEEGVAYYEANENYYRGCPKTQFLNVIDTKGDVYSLQQGWLDIATVDFNSETIKAIKEANGGSLDGDVITVNTTDNLGYSYIGINATKVSVDGNSGTVESKALRNALGTVLALYRQDGVDEYFGESASVINYPISNTSWAAPMPNDEGYEVAFSRGPDGKYIYTDEMTEDERLSAALACALEWFEKAGYTVNNGKVVAAAPGAKLEYTAWVPGGGRGEHPSFLVFQKAAAAFAGIGITLNIYDPYDTGEMWDGMGDTVEIWSAAFGSTIDPDMYDMYFSGDADHDRGVNQYMFAIDDLILNDLILVARTSSDIEYRKDLYKRCLDIVMEWGVEVPYYQRQNAVAFSSERIDISTLPDDMTTYYGWMNEIENIELNQ